jgi:hypothetical protein
VNWELPGNRGAVYGSETYKTLSEGILIDRIGLERGTFAAAFTTPLEMRSLKPGTDLTRYNAYIVVKPIPNVRVSLTAPAFDRLGYGTQMEFSMSIKELLKEGYLKPLW